MNTPRKTHSGEQCRCFGKVRPSRNLLLAVCGVIALGCQSEAGQGVLFPPNRFNPEEAGYYQSYKNVGGQISETIQDIQYQHFTAEYWLSIHDPSEAAPYRQRCLDGIGLLDERTLEKEEWLQETLPPPAFEKFHSSLQLLATQLRSSGKYKDLDPALRTTFRELNTAKLAMDERPAQPSESPSSRLTSSILIRPLFLPIVYNVTTGEWILSVPVTTPLGIVTFNLKSDTPSETIEAGPSLLKIVIADKARYVVLKPEMSVSFKDDELRVLGFKRERYMHVLTLAPIDSSQARPSTKPNVIPYDFDKEVRRAVPVYPERTP